MNPDVLRSMQNGRLPEYVRSQKFPYLADWDSVIDEFLDSAGAKADYRLIDSIDRVRIYQRVEK